MKFKGTQTPLKKQYAKIFGYCQLLNVFEALILFKNLLIKAIIGFLTGNLAFLYNKKF